jgi:hypothetical protein
LAALLLSSTAVVAQTPDGTVSRRILPPPDPAVDASKPGLPPRLEAPAGAPNILLVMTDGRDTGAPVTDYRTLGGRFEGGIEHVRVDLQGGAPGQRQQAPD